MCDELRSYKHCTGQIASSLHTKERSTKKQNKQMYKKHKLLHVFTIWCNKIWSNTVETEVISH